MRIAAMAALLLGCSTAQAAFERRFTGCEAAGTGGAAAAFPATCWSLLQNPALLARLRAPTASLFHVPQSFGLTELRRSSLAAAVPTGAGTFAGTAGVYGFDLYREVTIGAGWGLSFAGGVEAGCAVHYNALSIAGYGSTGSFGIDAGVAVSLTPEIVWGMSVQNINASPVGETGERLPRSLCIGAAYQPVDEVAIAADLVKDVRYPWELRLGITYAPLDPLVLRVGTCSEPVTLHWGAGIAVAFVRFEYAYTHHADLGGTHHLGVTFMSGGVP